MARDREDICCIGRDEQTTLSTCRRKHYCSFSPRRNKRNSHCLTPSREYIKHSWVLLQLLKERLRSVEGASYRWDERFSYQGLDFVEYPQRHDEQYCVESDHGAADRDWFCHMSSYS